MFKNFFIDINKKVLKKSTASGGATEKGASKSKKGDLNIDTSALIERLNGLVPAKLKVASIKPIDSSGFSPDGADFIAYSEYCRDIDKLLSGHMPYELIYGAFFLVNSLNKNTLIDALNRVSAIKKIDHFTEDGGQFSIPSFIIANSNKEYGLHELKNDIMNFYISKNVPTESEFEILMVYNEGLLVKDWNKGEHRYIGLETGDDTFMWFFILINEYLDVEREDIFDARKYVRSEKVYNEF
ncbi:MAG: hypothetical protein FWH53_08845 [Leptospirales bacterium]|nr:hypothetical protein [Leptospirales bacterium]